MGGHYVPQAAGAGDGGRSRLNSAARASLHDSGLLSGLLSIPLPTGAQLCQPQPNSEHCKRILVVVVLAAHHLGGEGAGGACGGPAGGVRVAAGRCVSRCASPLHSRRRQHSAVDGIEAGAAAPPAQPPVCRHAASTAPHARPGHPPLAASRRPAAVRRAASTASPPWSGMWSSACPFTVHTPLAPHWGCAGAPDRLARSILAGAHHNACRGPPPAAAGRLGP